MPSVLVCTDSVCVRVPQAASGGSFSVTLPMLNVDAEVDLQPLREGAVRALPVGVRVAVGRRCWRPASPLTWLLAVAGRPRAMLVVVPMPLPDRAIDVGLLLALLVIVTAPVRAPDVVGVNFTVTVQDAPTASVAQVFVWLKSPVAATPETVADVVPELVTVTVCVADELPTIVAGERQAGRVRVQDRPGCDTGARQRHRVRDARRGDGEVAGTRYRSRSG